MVYTFAEHFYLVSYVILCIFATLGNSIVLRTIYVKNDLRSPMFIIIGHLSVSSIQYSISLMLQLFICQNGFILIGRGSQLVCELNQWIGITGLMMGVNCGLFLVLDRILTIYCPTTKPIRIKLWIVVGWISQSVISLFFAIDGATLVLSYSKIGMFGCFNGLPEMSKYWFIQVDIPYKLTIVECLLMLLIIAISGVLIAIKQRYPPSTGNEDNGQSQRQLSKLIIGYVIGYMMFSLPIYVVHVMVTIPNITGKARYQCPPMITEPHSFFPHHFIVTNQILSCLVNPIVLGMYTDDFYGTFKILIRGRG